MDGRDGARIRRTDTGHSPLAHDAPTLASRRHVLREGRRRAPK